MTAEIITIGDEILIGQIVDTNSAWMAMQLNMAGIRVKQISSVSDDREHIIKAIGEAEERADLILMTGGLGPTKDDITKNTLAEYFNSKLVINEEVLAMVTEFFAKRGRELTELNRKQAEVPENCTAIINYNGTAPGMWFEQKGKIYVSMPGVPFEMQVMISEYVIPTLRSKFTLPEIYHRSVLTNGIGESFLAERIEAWEDRISNKGIKLAYLPSPGIVKLRLSAAGSDAKQLRSTVDQAIEELQPLIDEYIFGYEEYGQEPEQIEQIIARLFIEKDLKLSLAESCTGGYISHLITSVAGCSAFYQGCIVPYHNEFKQELLQVDPAVFSTDGAVSEACVVQMAQHALKKFRSDIALAVSGIAGPGGGSDEKPVGTVWIAVASAEQVVAKRFLFGTDRNRNIRMTAISGLNMLRKFVLSKKIA